MYGINTETTLRIFDGLAAFDVDPEIGKLPAEKAGARHNAGDFFPVADEHGVRGELRKKVWDVLGKMLAVAVEGYEILGSVIGGVSESGQQGDAFAQVRWVADHGDVEAFEKLAQIGIGAAV